MHETVNIMDGEDKTVQGDRSSTKKNESVAASDCYASEKSLNCSPKSNTGKQYEEYRNSKQQLKGEKDRTDLTRTVRQAICQTSEQLEHDLLGVIPSERLRHSKAISYLRELPRDSQDYVCDDKFSIVNEVQMLNTFEEDVHRELEAADDCFLQNLADDHISVQSEITFLNNFENEEDGLDLCTRCSSDDGSQSSLGVYLEELLAAENLDLENCSISLLSTPVLSELLNMAPLADNFMLASENSSLVSRFVPKAKSLAKNIEETASIITAITSDMSSIKVPSFSSITDRVLLERKISKITCQSGCDDSERPGDNADDDDLSSRFLKRSGSLVFDWLLASKMQGQGNYSLNLTLASNILASRIYGCGLVMNTFLGQNYFHSNPSVSILPAFLGQKLANAAVRERLGKQPWLLGTPILGSANGGMLMLMNDTITRSLQNDDTLDEIDEIEE